MNEDDSTMIPADGAASTAPDVPSGQIVLYEPEGSGSALHVRLDGETVWLTQQQIAELLQTSRENITMHLRNVFDEGELDRVATSKDFLQVRREGSRTVRRAVAHYNLDAIISVGYRVKSRVATQFRIWATERLSDYLVQGYAINQERLEQLGSIVRILSRSDDELIAGTADVLASYVPGLTLLRDYDDGTIPITPGVMPGWELTIDEARATIQSVKNEFPADTMLGHERGDSLEGIVAAIYQSFDGEELYSSVEEKAANLLYLTVKDHPLSDGNKRSAAALFVTFLAKNGLLLTADGTPRISNSALAATTLMVAMSDPKEKHLLIALLMHMISD